MTRRFHFTFEELERQYRSAIDLGYEFLTCQKYVEQRQSLPKLSVVNRIDVDFNCKKVERLWEIYERIGIKGSFFVRLHAPEYNPFSFENYRILRQLRDTGHEIGYHSEVIDQSAIWDEDSEDCLRRDLDVLGKMLDLEIRGVASHGGMTGLNNLDFWKERVPADFGLIYEGYDKTNEFGLFDKSFYISDSEWTRWKCYQNGKLVEGDRRSFGDHVKEEHELIYLLIHSDTYYNKHFYE